MVTDMVEKRERKTWHIVVTVIAVVVFLYFMRPSGPSDLAAGEQTRLLDWARQQLIATAQGEGRIALDMSLVTAPLAENGACFVSLYIGDTLRGCMNDDFVAHEALVDNVLRNTVLAASGDDRFPPVTPDEVEDIRIAISVMTTPELVSYDDPDALVDKLGPGLDGVILTVGDGVSAYLPEVWDLFPDPNEFLSQLCLKQGLPRDRWRDEPYPRIETFRAFTFSEPEISAPDDA